MKNEKQVASGGIWTHDTTLCTLHSGLWTNALTNWATKATHLAGSKSNISYTCVMYTIKIEGWYLVLKNIDEVVIIVLSVID